MSNFNEDIQKEKLKQIWEKEEEDLAKILAQKYKLPYADLSKMTIDLDYLKLIPEKESRQYKIAVFQGVGKKIQVAVHNPGLKGIKEILNNLKKEGYQIQLFLVSLNSLEKIWNRYPEIPEFVETSRGIIDISPEKIEELLNFTISLKKLKDLVLEKLTSGKQRRVSELLEIILGSALAMEASDVHLEPHEKNVLFRLRLDGVLHNVLRFDFKAYQLLLSRIKLISEMKLNIHNKAQDGRFTIKTKKSEIEVRSSVLPGPYGESVVLRILNPKTISLELQDLGMEKGLQKIIEKEIKKPKGMILTTGPTGSGKTTTLYAFLKKIRNPGIKIITVEDPIEYHLEGVSQTQVNPEKGYSFSTALRSILRQDPDIIMVGEIRELESAKIALNAALTGHLVLSTLHTNDAAGTIPRLIDLGANPAIIAPAINITMAQRLVRRLCNFCKRKYTPSEEEKEMIKKIVKTFPKNFKKPSLKNLKLYKAKGCEKCSFIGYKGRIGIFEAIIIDEEIEKLILKNPSETEIREIAKKQKILNIQQDAVLKILKGITSIDEAQRVVELTN